MNSERSESGELITREQVIATTHTDVHGHKIPRHKFIEMFESIGDDFVAGEQHDLSKPARFKMKNFRLRGRDDGELELICDIIWLDETAISEIGGFSIGFGGDAYVRGANGQDLEIGLEARLFDVNTVFEELCTKFDERVQFSVRELYRKSAVVETVIITITVFSVGKFAASFFHEIGARVAQYLLDLPRKDKKEGPKFIQLHIKDPNFASGTKFVINVRSADFFRQAIEAGWLKRLEELQLDLDKPVSRVSAEEQADGSLKVTTVIYLDGSYLKLKDSDEELLG